MNTGLNPPPSTLPGTDAAMPAAASRASDAPAPRRLASADLLGSDSEVEIDHRGVIYRLRLTSLGKLILTK